MCPKILTEHERWVIVESFFKERGLVKQHLESFNDFLTKGLQQIVNEQGEIETSIPGLKVRLKNIEVELPNIVEADGSVECIYPMDARLRNLTYAGSIYLNMSPVEDNIEFESVRVFIGKLPIIVKSVKCRLHGLSRDELIEHGEDPDDPGGYFIINGSERVLVAQEDLVANRILVDIGKSGSSATHTAKVFSTAAGYRVPVTLVRLKDGTLHISFPSVPGKVPLCILVRALGLRTDKEIAETVSDDYEIQQLMIPSLDQASAITTVEDALDYIGNRVAIGQTREYRIQRAQQILDKYFLPHLGTDSKSRRKKALFLGQMAEKLLELVLNRRKPDDKDHYANKRLKLAGDLLMSLFRVAFKNLCRDIRYQLERAKSRGRRINIVNLIRADIITERLRHAIATGNWVGGKVGVSQLLDRTNYMSTLSHLRRVVSPLSRSQPHFEARDLHPTQWGRLCPTETPEGPNCGLVKNLSLMTVVSVGVDEEIIEKKLIHQLGVIPIEIAKRERIKGGKVFLNGRLIGVHQEPEILCREFRRLRRLGKIHHEVSIAHYKSEYINEVYVNSDNGRVLRPVFVVEDGTIKITQETINKLKLMEWTWSDLIKNGIVEYLDAEEEENAYVAVDQEHLTKEHTHLEIAPSTIFGVCASIIPYAEHNQSPRNSYEAAMAKQALGLYTTNFQIRMDSRAHLLHYIQKPVVTTKASKVVKYEDRPAGQNLIVAVLSYSGYNIEDAIIINKSSVERGLSHSTFFKCYEIDEKRYPGGEMDRIEVPSSSVRGYRTTEAYRFLDEYGIIEPEIEVKGEVVLVGRSSPPRFLEEPTGIKVEERGRRETSLALGHGEGGIVDRVLLTKTSEGNKLVKVRIRELRVPEIGDKFASRHGQKGVIGLLVPQEDMPFTEDGIVPDLIINPHAIPSRMTLGQLLESISGKVGALEGRFVDGSTFENEKEEVVKEALKKLGFKPNGCEIMYDGRTGRILKTEVFIGVVYYQKLHHMVSDKIHARARGPVQMLTRQPTEGRVREGGLRFGEMERDCLISHGASMLLKDRLLEESDKTVVYVCESCGLMAYYDMNKRDYVCRVCGDKAKISPVVISYAFKLLLQELMGLTIMPRLILEEV
ncbi:MAG: DNA-directed RNA polymerase subunit B [Candidatus Methanomethylicia archaeon]|nr:DNA-directed RNA polymerase subunit B [Candidatus Methanomethylicia archaeon]MCX8169284.1 DNA-directed RNA polymerase subunit B [Candidatus Methanomethylicia archaeon]MDW7988933.1 DNA-directed RNA polymerase subunit B [Nitrososphaerota archaeon]